MSWWGKIVGGTLGMLVGGPIGALLGGALGHTVDVSIKGLHLGGPALEPGEQERVQTAFFTATFSVMGAVAKADGHVSRGEIALAESLMEQMHLSPDMRQAAMRLFIKGKQPDFPLEEVMSQFRTECQRRTNIMRMFLEIQVQAAYADGSLHPEEERLLLEVCAMLGFHETAFRQIEALVRFSMGLGGSAGGQHYQQRSSGSGAQSSGEGVTRAEAYELLGVTPDSSAAEIKKAYRRLMSQHHPDKLVAKGLPEEMIRLATEKTRKIREAYELIRK